MLEQRIVDAIGRQRWLDSPSKALQQAIKKTFAAGGSTGQQIENVLHGTGMGLGVPLHPVVTDIPIGAWTVALVLDALDTINGDDDFAPGADAAIAVGLVGALGAVPSGLTDWQHLNTKPLHLGLVHGVMNISATLLYSIAWLLRRRGARGAGKGLAIGAYTITVLAAHLGGDLIYKEQIGVTHAKPVWTPLEYAPVLAESDLPEGERRKVEIGGRRIFLVRQNGRIYALDESCTHLGGPLSEGKLEDGSVICPWHGSRFALADGQPLDGPATVPQPCFETRIRNGQIEVRAAQ
jgi:nitrite reductase/ring-hydroxylating ferredoxin subunit/uncharacterized membrane protein